MKLEYQNLIEIILIFVGIMMLAAITYNLRRTPAILPLICPLVLASVLAFAVIWEKPDYLIPAGLLMVLMTFNHILMKQNRLIVKKYNVIYFNSHSKILFRNIDHNYFTLNNL